MEWLLAAIGGVVGAAVGVGGVMLTTRQQLKDTQRKELRAALNAAARDLAEVRYACREMRRLWKESHRWEDSATQDAERVRRDAEWAVRSQLSALSILVGSSSELCAAYDAALQAEYRMRRALHEWKRNPELQLDSVTSRHAALRDAEDDFIKAAHRAAGLDRIETPLAPPKADEDDDSATWTRG